MLFVVIKIVTTRRIRQTPGNAIHTFAGVQLRLACADYMQEAGRPEPTGHAVVTDAYNLPSRHVVHTVGPIANGLPTPQHRDQLASCYRACLDAAAAAGDTSIAFCCISTGVFDFPQDEACAIAVRTVRDWLDSAAGGARTGVPFVRVLAVIFGFSWITYAKSLVFLKAFDKFSDPAKAMEQPTYINSSASL